MRPYYRGSRFAQKPLARKLNPGRDELFSNLRISVADVRRAYDMAGNIEEDLNKAVNRPAQRLLVAKGDAALGQVVGGHLNINPITYKHPNAKFAHFARRPRNDLMIIL